MTDIVTLQRELDQERRLRSAAEDELAVVKAAAAVTLEGYEADLRAARALVFPTLGELGLLDEVDALERICALGARGKYAGQPLDPNARLHLEKATGHYIQAIAETRDVETGESHLLHAACRLLMAQHALVQCRRVDHGQVSLQSAWEQRDLSDGVES